MEAQRKYTNAERFNWLDLLRLLNSVTRYYRKMQSTDAIQIIYQGANESLEVNTSFPHTGFSHPGYQLKITLLYSPRCFRPPPTLFGLYKTLSAAQTHAELR